MNGDGTDVRMKLHELRIVDAPFDETFRWYEGHAFAAAEADAREIVEQP